MAVGVRALEAGKALIRLAIDDNAVTSGLRSTERRLKTIGRSIAGIGAAITTAGAAGLTLFLPTIKAASDLEETMSKFNVVFGNQADSVKAWGDNLAAQIGRSEKTIAEFLGNHQDLFVPLGFDAESALFISQTLTQLGFDLASFNNKSDDEAFLDLQRAFVGTGETMVKYGAVVNDATIKQELFNRGIDPKNATLQEKAIAKLAIILDKTSSAHGDATNTAGSFANQLKKMQGIITDVSGEIGKVLTPQLAKLISRLNELASPIKEFIQDNQQLVQSIAGGAVAITAIGATLLATGGAVTLMGAAVGAFTTVLAAIATPAGAAAVALAYVARQSGELERSLESLSDFIVVDLQKAFRGITDAINVKDMELAGEIIGTAFNIGLARSLAKTTSILTQFQGQINPVFKLLGEEVQLLTLEDKFELDIKGLQGKLDALVETAAASGAAIGDAARKTSSGVDGASGELDGLMDKLGGTSRDAAARHAEAVDKMVDDAKRLEDQTATPYERFLQKRQEINDLFDAGAITGITADRGLKAAHDEYKRTDEAQQAIIDNEERLKRAADDRRASLQADADSIVDSIKTPAERIQDELEKLRKVAAVGLLDPEQFDRALEALEQKKRDLNDVTDTFQGALSSFGPILGGRFAEQIFGKQGTDVLQNQLLQVQKQNLDVAKKTERNTRSSGAKFQ